ncbi:MULTISPECIES: capsule biosynthesis protein [Jannaschia]|nr:MULTISPECIES: capsule biosynthesis protein [unclassified Jannaschia]
MTSAAPAQPRGRHWLITLSFLLLVVAPTALCAWYLWERAADRYVSTAGFSVRTEEAGSAIESLAGITGLSGSSSSDTDILYDFIQSQQLVRQVQDSLDLRTIWSKVPPDQDPIYAYHPPGTIEDLTAYWRRMVKVYNIGSTGLLELRVQAFDPDDAQRIAQEIQARSSDMINELSAIAREDATRYARDELDGAVERLKVARQAITRFRNRTQIVDPQASIQSQMGILSSLQGELAQTLIDLDILVQTAPANDPRIVQLKRRIETIESRIAEERSKLGLGSRPRNDEGQDEGGTAEGGELDAFADLVGEYESLIVDLNFAEQSYTAALAGYDSSLAESRRQSRYLAAHVRPTLAESAAHPERTKLISLVALFSFLAWGIIVLAAYALRDRR